MSERAEGWQSDSQVKVHTCGSGNNLQSLSEGIKMMQHLEWNEATPDRDRGRMHHFQAFSHPSGEPNEYAWSETLLRPNKSHSVIINAPVGNIYKNNNDLFLFMNIAVSFRTVSGPFWT